MTIRFGSLFAWNSLASDSEGPARNYVRDKLRRCRVRAWRQRNQGPQVAWVCLFPTG
jgi:hypothetical protein